MGQRMPGSFEGRGHAEVANVSLSGIEPAMKPANLGVICCWNDKEKNIRSCMIELQCQY